MAPAPGYDGFRRGKADPVSAGLPGSGGAGTVKADKIAGQRRRGQHLTGIEIQQPTRRCGGHLAAPDLSFAADSGQIYGFPGPSGAGKSTAMNIVTGCLAAAEGSVRIDGYGILEQPEAASRRIGYLPELPPLYIIEYGPSGLFSTMPRRFPLQSVRNAAENLIVRQGRFPPVQHPPAMNTGS